MISPLLFAALLGTVNPVVVSADNPEAHAKTLAAGMGGLALLTSGSGSMQPLITGRVWLVVVREDYAQIIRGEVLIYHGRPSGTKPERKSLAHRAVLKDRGGWIMSGDANRWSENWDRVTPANYTGTVKIIVQPKNQSTP